jgi:hypothetical protein
MEPLRNTPDEERIAELLRSLPPVPRGWVQAAQELPAARTQIERIVDLAEADAAYRTDVLGDLEQALLAAGVEPRRRTVEQLRSRLAD